MSFSVLFRRLTTDNFLKHFVDEHHSLLFQWFSTRIRVKEVYVVLLEKTLTSTPTLYSGTALGFSLFLLAHHMLIAVSMPVASQCFRQ